MAKSWPGNANTKKLGEKNKRFFIQPRPLSDHANGPVTRATTAGRGGFLWQKKGNPLPGRMKMLSEIASWKQRLSDPRFRAPDRCWPKKGGRMAKCGRQKIGWAGNEPRQTVMLSDKKGARPDNSTWNRVFLFVLEKCRLQTPFCYFFCPMQCVKLGNSQEPPSFPASGRHFFLSCFKSEEGCPTTPAGLIEAFSPPSPLLFYALFPDVWKKGTVPQSP